MKRKGIPLWVGILIISLAIAGVIAMEPEILILDEPAAGLDPMGREDILGGVRSYQRARGSTVIIVSHSMEDMARYADRIVVMDEGEIMMQGTPGEVFSRGEELTSIGLDIPQITRLMQMLALRGVKTEATVYTVDEAIKQLTSLLSDKRGEGEIC